LIRSGVVMLLPNSRTAAAVLGLEEDGGGPLPGLRFAARKITLSPTTLVLRTMGAPPAVVAVRLRPSDDARDAASHAI
jgi:hypothetical protein